MELSRHDSDSSAELVFALSIKFMSRIRIPAVGLLVFVIYLKSVAENKHSARCKKRRHSQCFRATAGVPALCSLLLLRSDTHTGNALA